MHYKSEHVLKLKYYIRKLYILFGGLAKCNELRRCNDVKTFT